MEDEIDQLTIMKEYSDMLAVELDSFVESFRNNMGVTTDIDTEFKLTSSETSGFLGVFTLIIQYGEGMDHVVVVEQFEEEDHQSFLERCILKLRAGMPKPTLH